MTTQRVMLLAAGRGARLRPLTDTIPKPLMRVQGKTLLEHQLQKISDAGFSEVLINVSWLADSIIDFMNSYKSPLKIVIQHESKVLETGGGIARALPWLCANNDHCVVTNADIWHDFDLSRLHQCQPDTAHLILSEQLIDDQGDFDLDDDRVLHHDHSPYVFTGISCLHKSLFTGADTGVFPLTDVLMPAVHNKQVTGEIHNGFWSDLGTKKRLDAVNG